MSMDGGRALLSLVSSVLSSIGIHRGHIDGSLPAEAIYKTQKHKQEKRTIHFLLSRQFIN